MDGAEVKWPFGRRPHAYGEIRARSKIRSVDRCLVGAARRCLAGARLLRVSGFAGGGHSSGLILRLALVHSSWVPTVIRVLRVTTTLASCTEDSLRSASWLN